jgi:predicted membrane protein
MKTPKDYSGYSEHEFKASIKRKDRLSSVLIYCGAFPFFMIPIGFNVAFLLPFVIGGMAVGVPLIIIGCIINSSVQKQKKQFEDDTGITVEKETLKIQEEKVREERHDKFLHGLDKNNAITDPKPVLSDAELIAKINELSPKIKMYDVLIKVFGVLGFIGFFPLNILFPLLGFVPFIPCIIFAIRWAVNKNQLKCIVGNSVIRGVLTDIFALTNYSPGCHISTEAIQDTRLIPSWNRIRGSDLIEGAYKGIRFSFSDLCLKHESNSGKSRSSTTRFEGQWLIIELAKELPHRLSIKEDSKVKSDVETENIEFNKKFQIETEDPHTAFFVLTPHFMEYILNARRRAGAKMHMCFDGTRAHIALHSGRDLFEPCSKQIYDMKNIEMLRNQIQWDAKYITGIIDELLLNENLFNTGGQNAAQTSK